MVSNGTILLISISSPNPTKLSVKSLKNMYQNGSWKEKNKTMEIEFWKLERRINLTDLKEVWHF